MNIEITQSNRQAAIDKATRALEFEMMQVNTLEKMGSPIHALYGVTAMVNCRAMKVQAILTALESPYNLSLSMEEAKLIHLI